MHVSFPNWVRALGQRPVSYVFTADQPLLRDPAPSLPLSLFLGSFRTFPDAGSFDCPAAISDQQCTVVPTLLRASSSPGFSRPILRFSAHSVSSRAHSIPFRAHSIPFRAHSSAALAITSQPKYYLCRQQRHRVQYGSLATSDGRIPGPPGSADLEHARLTRG